MRVFCGFIASALLAGCTHSPTDLEVAQVPAPGVVATAGGVVKRAEIRPRTNAHTHLMSPAAKEFYERTKLIAPLPAIRIPAPLEQVLRAREQVSGSPPVGELFTQDAIILELEQGRWDQGHERINRFLGFMPKQVQYIPKAYAMGEATAHVAGNIRFGNSQSEGFNFVLALTKSTSGKWQIAAESFTAVPQQSYHTVVTAEHVIEQLNSAGIQYGVLLGLGYWYPDLAGARAENDWTIAQAALYPDRLVPFCGVNPTLEFAIEELERCAKIPAVKGMKIHLANAGINLENPAHRTTLRNFFAAANLNRIPIVVHIRPIGNYKRMHAEMFLNEIMAAAPDIPVQIAHAANSAEAFSFFGEAIAAGHPNTRNLYFDWAQMPAEVIRKVPLDRIFFGTDMIINANAIPMRDNWEGVLQTELSEQEIATIAGNVPPYIK